MSSGKTVSLCIIAKDEEKCIASCIKNAKHLVDEIILVDTGSSDRTEELARQMEAKVFHFHWSDNFAAARNFSLSRATKEWILVLDADEIMEAVKPEEFQPLLETPGVEGYFLNIRSYLSDGLGITRDQVVRLFKNRPEYRFEGAIHEQVATSIKRHNHGGGLAFSNLIVNHFGYLDPQVRQKDKRRRNIGLIEKVLTVNSGDTFLHYCLGIEYYQSCQTIKGNEQMEKALSLMRGDEGYLHDTLVSLGLGLMQTGEPGKLSSFLDKALVILPGDPDLRLIRGLIDMEKGRYQAASVEIEAALAGGVQVAPTSRIHSLLGDALYMQRRYIESENHYLLALKQAPEVLYPLTRILGLKQEGKDSISWHELSFFAPQPILTRLREDLLRKGESALALILALLSVVREAGSGVVENIARTCLEYQRLLESSFLRAGPLRKFMVIYSEEMLLHGDAACRNISCNLYLPTKEIASLAMEALELTIKTLCPIWSPMDGTVNRKD